MSTIVIDASVVGPLLIPDESIAEHPSLVPALESGDVVVPGHWHLEVASLGRSAMLRKRIAREPYLDGIAALGDYFITVDRQTSAQAWSDTLTLSLRRNLTPYDAAYIELAVRLGCSLLCDDDAMAAAARAEGVKLL